MKTAPAIDMTAVLSSCGSSLPEAKRHRSNPNISGGGRRRGPTEADQSNVLFPTLLSQQSTQSGYLQAPLPQLPVMAPPQGNLFTMPATNTAGNQQIQGLSFVASYDAPLSFLQQMLDSAPSSFAASIPNVLEQQDMSSLAKEDVKMAVVDNDCAGKISRRTTASPTTDGDENNVIAEADAAADALVNDEKNTLDNEEFARAMEPDENFFGLGNSDAIADVFDGGDIFEDQLY